MVLDFYLGCRNVLIYRAMHPHSYNLFYLMVVEGEANGIYSSHFYLSCLSKVLVLGLIISLRCDAICG